MTSRISAAVAAVCLLLPGATVAKADCPHDDPDEICIVFDHPDGCCLNCWPDNPAGIPFAGEISAYIVLQNASAPAGVLGYDFVICNEDGSPFAPPPGCSILGYRYPAGAIVVGTEPEIVVGFADPIAWAPCILMVAIDLAIDCTDCWCFGVRGSNLPGPPPMMLYADGADPGILHTMQPCTGSEGVTYSMACINCASCLDGPPIALEGATWSKLKGLYR